MKEITIMITIYNSMPFLELFWISFTNNLKKDKDLVQIIFIDAGSTDGCAEYLKHLEDQYKALVRVIFASSLPKNKRIVIENIKKRDFVYSEGMWDYLIANNFIHTKYYIGIHVDVYFKKDGLFRFLLNKIKRDKKTVLLSPVDCGGICGRTNNIYSMPRLFPYIVLGKTKECNELGICWSRKDLFIGRTNYRILYDNGCYAFFRFFNKNNKKNYKFCELMPNELKKYLFHLGFSWPKNVKHYKKHSVDYKSSSRIAAKLIYSEKSRLRKP